MGWGDEIMAAGRAREAQETDPRPVAILNRNGVPRWHEAWRGNPRLVHPRDVGATDHQTVQDGPRARPYVDTRDRRVWRFRRGLQRRGELYLDDRERRVAPGGRYVVVATLSKRPGKDWGLDRFRAAVKAVDANWVQVGPPGTPLIAGATKVDTNTFRQAAAVIAGAQAALLPEGGLHHAAAAFRVPAVVLFGHFIHPDVTGYPDHINVYDPDGPCGITGECPRCAEFWRELSVETVAGKVEQLLERVNGDASRPIAPPSADPVPDEDPHRHRGVHGHMGD